jgi:signal transduction histidine kinase
LKGLKKEAQANMAFNTGQKVIAAFGLSIVFLLILSWLGHSTPRHFVTYIELRRESVQNLEHLALFASYMKDAETGQRGYLLTGLESYLTPYSDARAGIERELRELRRSFAGHGAQQERIAAIESLVQLKLSEVQQTIDLLQSDPQHGLTDALEIVNEGSGKQYMDEIRRLVGEMQDEEILLRDKWTSVADASASQLFWVSSLAGPVAVCLVALSGSLILRDLAARSRAEETIRRMNDELEERVEQRTSELVATNRALNQKNQEVETFVYSVSHDLRSPLVNLQGFSQELLIVGQELRSVIETGGLPDAVRARGLAIVDGDITESVGFIKAAVLRLSSIIDALLRLSRAGRIVYQWQVVDLSAALRRIVDAQAAVIAEKGVQVEQNALAPAWGDPTALEQVFANLVANAVNYLDPRRPGRIVVGQVAHGEQGSQTSATETHTYFVRDNGQGIPDDAQQRVFHAFQRLHPETAPGEGIGLTLVSRIVERHGGRIWFKSIAGEGTTFFVTLPSRGLTERPSGTISKSETRVL